jgi:hypothetical protein
MTDACHHTLLLVEKGSWKLFTWDGP